MVYFLNAEGALVRCVPEGVHRGSAEANKIVLVAPFAESCAVSAAFTLPTGEATRPYLLACEGRLGKSAAAGEGGDAAAQACVWSLALPACVSSRSGRAEVQFFFTDAEGACTASECIPFTVGCGVEVRLPSAEDAGAYAEMLAALAQVSGALTDGAFAARSLRAYNEGAAYGKGEVVFCPAGEGHGAALVRSLTAENTQPPYTGGEAADGWEELFSFSALLEEFGQQLGAFTATNVLFSSQLPTQGQEGTLYAVVSSQDASMFTLYAWVGGWVALGSKNIQLLPQENAVHYTAQQLTAEQQAQARANIGAAEGVNSVTPAQLEAGLSSVFAFRNEGEALPEGLRTGAGVYTYKLAVPEASFGQNVVAYNFTDPSFSPSGWIVTGGEGTAPAPAFGADGLQIAQGLFADRGTAAIANPFKGYGLESRGITVALYGTVTGSLINDFESMFGFCDAADSADSAFDFFAVTGSGTGIRFNANGAGNLGETYFDITGGAVLDLTEPSLYVLTVTGSAITVYRNGAQQASYPYTADGANTAYRTNVLEKIAAMDYFLLGCSTGLLQWGNPAMQVQRLVLCPFALTAEEVQAMYRNSYYELKTLSGGEQAVAVERAKRLMPGEELGRYSAVYFTEDGTPAENPNICLRTGSAPFYSYSVAVGNDAEASEGGVAIGEDANGANGVAVGALSNAGAQCVAVGTSASAGSATVSGASAFGYNAAATAANTMQLGGSGNSYVYYYGTLQARSDERDKADIADFDDEKSLEFVTSLRTFSYVRNPRGLYEYTEEEHAGAKELHRKYGLAPYDKAAHAAGTKKGSRRRAGLSAQDVQAKMEQVFGGEIANLVCDSLHDLRAAGETIPEGVESQLHVGYTAPKEWNRSCMWAIPRSCPSSSPPCAHSKSASPRWKKNAAAGNKESGWRGGAPPSLLVRIAVARISQRLCACRGSCAHTAFVPFPVGFSAARRFLLTALRGTAIIMR